MSKSLHDSLLNNNLFSIKEMNRKDALNQVKDKKLIGYLQVSSGFENTMVSGDKPKITFMHSPDFTNRSLVNQIVSNVLSRIAIQTKAAAVWSSYSKQSWKEMCNTLDKNSASSAPSIQKVSKTK